MNDFLIGADQRVFIAGKTGSGKTVLSAALFAPVARLMIFDVKGSLSGWGARDFKDARGAFERGDDVRVRVTNPDDFPAALELCLSGNCTLYIDEFYGVIPPRGKVDPAINRAAWAIWTRGRESNVRAVAVSQRPTWLPLFVLSESDHFFIFRLNLEEDRQRVAEITSLKLATPIPARHRFGFWYYSHESGRAQYIAQLALD